MDFLGANHAKTACFSSGSYRYRKSSSRCVCILTLKFLNLFMRSLGKQWTTGNPLKSIQNSLVILFEDNKRLMIKLGGDI